MTREIKFRAWDKINNKMILDCGIYNHFYFGENYQKNIAWMQFTGLKDKNRKEIYEGDIVRVGDEKSELIEEIKWVDSKNWNGKCAGVGFVNHATVYETKVEIIGNIYENAELISKMRDNKTDV